MADQSLGRAVLELTTDPKAFTKGLSQAYGQAKTFSNKLAGIQQSAQRMGRSMTRSLTLPLVALATASTKMAMDYEESMSKIVGLVGVARDQVDGWSDDILEISGSLGKAPKEMADAMFFITSAGLRGEKAFNAMTMAAKASAGGLGDMTSVADALTSAMNAYGDEALNAEEATDVLVATVREGKLEAAALASTIGTVIPLAAQMGVEFNEVGAAIASMTRIGFSVDQSVTSLQAILTGLLKPTAQAEEALARFGTSSAEVRDQIENEGLVAALLNLKDRIGDNDVAMAEIFPNVRALRGVLGLVGENAENTAAIMENMRDVTGSTDKAFEEASETLKFKFNKAMSDLKTALTYIGLEIGPIIIPILEEITGWIKDLAEKFKNLAPEAKQTMLKFAMFAALIGPMAMALAGLIAVFRGISIAIRLMANPYVAVGLAIVGVTILIIKNWEAIKTTATRIGAALTDIWEGTKTVMTAVFKGIAAISKAWLIDKFNVLVAKLNTTWMKIQNLYAKAHNFISGLFGGKQIAEWSEGQIHAAEQAVVDAQQAGDLAIAAADASMRQAIDAGKAQALKGEQALAGVFTDIGEGIKDKAKGIVDGVVGAFEQGKEVWETLGVADLVSGIQDAIAGIGEAMTDAAEETEESLINGAEAIVDAADALAAVPGMQNRPETDMYGEPSGPQPWVSAGTEPKSSLVDDVGEAAESPITWLINKLVEAAMSVENFAKVINAVDNLFQDIIGVLAPAISGVLQPVVDALSKIAGVIGNALMPIIVALGPVFDLIIQMVMSVLMPVLNNLAFWMDIITMILIALEPVFKAFNVAMEVLSAPFKWLGDLLSWVGGKFKAFGHWLGHVFAFEFGKAANVSFGGGFSSDAFSGLEGRIAAIWNKDYSVDATVAGYDAGGGSGGGQATYEQQRPIFVDIDVHDNEYFGEGSWRDFAIAVRDEFEQIGVLGI